MCGRYQLDSSIEELKNFYNIDNMDCDDFSRGEIFPSMRSAVVYKKGIKRLDAFTWGFRMKNNKTAIINARSETVNQKPFFRDSFINRRCIIPANYFYEWNNKGKNNLKYRIGAEGKKLISFAGIYNTFLDERGNSYNGFVILTTSANSTIEKVHHRMPVIFTEKDMVDNWLSEDREDNMYLLKYLKSIPSKSTYIEEENGYVQMSLFD